MMELKLTKISETRGGNKMKDFSSYTFGEGRTGGGQLIEFTCGTEDVEMVKAFLVENVKNIEIPVTGRVNVPHGGFGCYTRYEIVQHKYAGGGYGPSCGGFIEVLEIKNPPENRHGIVTYKVLNEYGSFIEWDTLDNAKSAFEKEWCSSKADEEFKEFPGFIRQVECGLLQPWFYAIGDEELINDFAFPEGLQDDSVYRFGQKFVVTNREGYTEVKTCMGVRFIQKESADSYCNRSEKKPEIFRIICWDDGTMTREDCHQCNQNSSRPIKKDEMWITDAFSRFGELLSGKSERFEIKFTDGYKFVGRVSKNGNKAKCSQGRYLLRVHFEGQKNPEEGYVDFTPTLEFPDIIGYVQQAAERKKEKLEKIEIISKEVKKGGKKWSGVFHKSPY